MKCNCAECNGTGVIQCTECDGKGVYSGSIEQITLVTTMKHYDELAELQKDARRVIEQTKQLVEMNPARKDSYEAQLKVCLFVINGQADRLVEKP